MNGQLHRQINEWVRQTNRGTIGKINRQPEGQVDRQDFLSSTFCHSFAIVLTDGIVNGQMDRWADRRTHR